MDDKRLRRHCADVIDRLGIPAGADADALCDRLEDLRGRPISLVEVPLPTGAGKPCGLWVATHEADYIFYQQLTTKAHQQHIVRHEIGHMALGHEAAPVMQNEVARLLMPTLSPELVRGVLGRTQYTNDEERAAELVASLMPLRAAGTITHRSPDVSPRVASLASRLSRSLERGSHG